MCRILKPRTLAPPPDAPARQVGADAPALVLGDPAYTPGRLARLPGAGVEAAVIGRARGVGALVGDKAEREPVLEALRSARVAHLATHGLLVEAAPYSAELALAGTDSLTVPDLMGTARTPPSTSPSSARATAAGAGRPRPGM